MNGIRRVGMSWLLALWLCGFVIAVEPTPNSTSSDVQRRLAIIDEQIRAGTNDAETLLERGRCLSELGRIAEAISVYDGILQAEPMHEDALRDRSALLYEQQKYLLATKDLTKLLELSPADPELRLGRALCSAGAGLMPQALADLDAFQRLAPKDHRGYLLRGRCLQRTDRRSEAEAAFVKAAELAPGDVTIYDDRGKNRIHLGNLEGALADFNKIIELGDKSLESRRQRCEVLRMMHEDKAALDDAEYIVENGPPNPQDFLLRSVCHLSLARVGRDSAHLESAWRDANQAVQLGPDFSLAYVNRARAADALGRSEEALSDYNRAIQLDGKQPEVFLQRATHYVNRNQFKEARADLDRAVALDPRHARAYAERGRCAFNQNDFTAALRDYDRALELMPGLLMARENRGVANLSLHQWHDARQDFDKVLALNPRRALAMAYRGQSYVQERRGALGLPDLNRALELDPLCAVAYRWRGSYYMPSDANRAIADLNRAIEIDPEPHDFAKLSEIYLARDELDTALRQAEEALRRDSRLFVAHLLCSMIHYRRHDYQQAIEAATTALAIEPKNTLALQQRAVAQEAMKKSPDERSKQR